MSWKKSSPSHHPHLTKGQDKACLPLQSKKGSRRLRWGISPTRGKTNKGQNNDKPSIYVQSSVVILGETASIYCRTTNAYYKAFMLYKKTLSNWVLYRTETSQYEAEFQIAKVKKSDGGSYFCIYCYGTYNGISCSGVSDIVSIKIKGQLYPKPSITVVSSGRVTFGENIAIQCNSGECLQAEFFLYRVELPDLQLYATKKATQNGVVFSFPSTKQFNGGIYQCKYCCQSDSYKWCSNYSDQVHINIRDPSLAKPTINVQPNGQHVVGMNVTIECQGPEKGLYFSLHNASHLIGSKMAAPDRNMASFPFYGVRLEDAGNYSCEYHRRGNQFLWSEPSDFVDLETTNMVEPRKSVAILLGSITASLLFLFILLLFSFVIWRRRKRSIAYGSNQPMPMPLEFNTETESAGITYAELNHASLKYKQTNVSDSDVPGSSIYAVVAQDKNRAIH